MVLALSSMRDITKERNWEWKIPASIPGCPEGAKVQGKVWAWAKELMAMAGQIQKAIEGMRALDRQKMINKKIESRKTMFKQGKKKAWLKRVLGKTMEPAQLRYFWGEREGTK